MHKDNWDDLRYVLSVAQTGSVSAAARELGVNHATVLRRVAAFEERYGVTVFDRTSTGYSVPRERARLIDAVREVEAAHMAVVRAIAGARAPLSGAVKITSTDTFCVSVLPRVLARVRAGAPGLRIDLLSSNAHVDLARIEAEITVRPAMALSPELIGEAAAELGFGVYVPAMVPDSQSWLGLSGALSRTPVAEWLRQSIAESAFVGAADSFVVLREMVAAGLGRAVMPRVLGDHDPRLMHLPDAMPEFLVPVWVASHADLADAPRLAAVRARLAEALCADAPRLRGA